MFPFHEKKIRCDEYGEIIRSEDYKLAEAIGEEDNKENIIKQEPDDDISKYQSI